MIYRLIASHYHTYSLYFACGKSSPANDSYCTLLNLSVYLLLWYALRNIRIQVSKSLAFTVRRFKNAQQQNKPSIRTSAARGRASGGTRNSGVFSVKRPTLWQRRKRRGHPLLAAAAAAAVAALLLPYKWDGWRWRISTRHSSLHYTHIIYTPASRIILSKHWNSRWKNLDARKNMKIQLFRMQCTNFINSQIIFAIDT